MHDLASGFHCGVLQKNGTDTHVSGRRSMLQAIGVLTALTCLPALTSASTKAPTRIVVAGGVITEALFALGMGSDIAGVDLTSHYPDAAKDLPQIGYVRSLSAEGILSLAPTHLLVTADAGPASVLQQIQRAGVEVVVFDNPPNFDGMLERMAAIGAAMHKQAEADALIGQIHARWRHTTAQVRTLKQQRDERLGGRSARILFVLMEWTPSFKTASDVPD